MKRSLLVFCFLSFLSAGYCQSFKGGVRAGFSTSQISGDDLAGFNKFGAYAGGFVNYPIAKKWKFQPEINFIMKGSSRYFTVNSTDFDMYILAMYYVEVPFLFKYNIIKGFEVEFGPTINFLFHSVEKDNNGKIPAREPFRIYEVSGIIGLNYLFKEHYGISLRWSSSIVPVRVPSPDYGNYRITKKQFNDVIAFTLYYQF